MVLPDNAFFELIRTVFGKIKTPFNKQVLVNDLEKFLLREDIKKNIAGYISDSDARIIAAVAVLNEPTPDELNDFFDGEVNFSELHDSIINLEERFIIYRFFSENKKQRVSRLALNPVLRSVLSPVADDISALFPSVAANIAANDMPQDSIINDRILAALLSFVSQNRLFLRAGGGFRQKVGKMAETMFPGLPLPPIVGSLQALGLFFAEGETLVPDYRRFAVFGALNRLERLSYCAAGILCYADFQKNASNVAFSPWLFRAMTNRYAQIIINLYNAMDPERLYRNTTIKKMAYILERANHKNDDEENKCDLVINAMEQIGMVVPVSDKNDHELKTWRKVPLADPSIEGPSAEGPSAEGPSAEGPSAEGAPIVMDTLFTFLVYPGITYNDAITIVAFSDIIEAGITVRFEINRDSVVRAFNRGFTASEIIEHMRRLSNNRISENLIFTLSDWEKRYHEVTLRKGLVLTLSQQQRYLAETRPLAGLITETLAPGIYLLRESAEEKTMQVLKRAGIAIIARGGEQGAGKDLPDEESSGGNLRNYFMLLNAEKSPFGGISPAARESAPSDPILSASTLIDNFRSILEQVQTSGEVREELNARINRRLVLCDAQLKDAFIRFEKLEANGMDYMGKSLIAKQAISAQSPVEVVWPGKQKQERVFGIPIALEKVGNENFLVVEPSGGGNTGTQGDTGAVDDSGRIAGDIIRVALGRISLLRRIKKSIFEG